MSAPLYRPAWRPYRPRDPVRRAYAPAPQRAYLGPPLREQPQHDQPADIVPIGATAQGRENGAPTAPTASVRPPGNRPPQPPIAAARAGSLPARVLARLAEHGPATAAAMAAALSRPGAPVRTSDVGAAMLQGTGTQIGRARAGTSYIYYLAGQDEEAAAMAATTAAQRLARRPSPDSLAHQVVTLLEAEPRLWTSRELADAVGVAATMHLIHRTYRWTGPGRPIRRLVRGTGAGARARPTLWWAAIHEGVLEIPREQ